MGIRFPFSSTQTQDTFCSMKTFGLMSGNFHQYDWNSTFPEFSEKITTSREGIAKFSEISYREYLFHFIFLSECPEFSVEWLEV